MKRVDTTTAAADLHGPGKNGWRDGVAAATLASTRGNASYSNAVQEEIARAVELSGQALNPASYEQLHQAIRRSRSTLTVTSTIIRTSDGSGTNYQIKDVCFAPGSGLYGDGLFIAAGYVDGDEAIWSSYDGFSWVKVVSSAIGSLLGIAHGGTGALGSRRFVVVGFDSFLHPVIATVEDGGGALVPQAPPAGIASIAAWLTSVCWHDRGSGVGVQRWAACGRRSGATTALIYGTQDGTAWVLTTPAAGYTGSFRKCISTARGATAGAVIAIGEDGEIQRSVDAITYTRQHSDAALGALTSITRLDNGTLLVAASQARTLLRSIDDGLSFTEVYTPEFALAPWGIDDVHVIELVTHFRDIAIAYVKNSTNDVRMGVISYDGGVTWPEAFRLPTLSTSPGVDPWHTPTAASDDGQRFILLSNYSTTTAMVFASVTPDTIAL